MLNQRKYYMNPFCSHRLVKNRLKKVWEELMDVKLNNGFTEFKFDINRIVNKES